MLLCRVFFATCWPWSPVSLAVVLLLASTGCHTRTAVTTDGGEPHADAGRSDGTAKSDAAHHTCKQLVAAGTTLLGPTSERNARPAMTHDGTHFVVAWLHGKDFSATSPATLRFTRVDSAGKAETAAGVKVGAAISVVTPALAHGDGEYGLLYRAPSPATGDATVLARLRADGIPKQKAVAVSGDAREVALARAGAGYAALLVEQDKTTSDRLAFATVDAKGALTRKVIHTGGGYWLSWLSPRAGGYSAAWDHTFARLDASGGMMHTTTLKSGMAAVYSASVVGYALTYLDLGAGSKENVWFQLLDPLGKPAGPARAVGTNASFGAMISRYIAMVWTGDMLIVVYTQYQSSGASRLVAQLLDAKGAKVGQPAAMPICSPKQPGVDLAAAWGGGTLTVASMGGYSGTKASQLCLSRIRCVQ